jgi:hemoglobin-like flavoprotein
MSNSVWESQLEINQIFDKRIALAGDQVTALTELVIAQGKLIQQLSELVKPTTPTTPTGCQARHCACADGEM